MNNIIGQWNEYSICRNNCQNGFYPPLSGSCNNDLWKWRNEAWIPPVTQYAVYMEAEAPIICQFGRLDTTQNAMAYYAGIGYAGEFCFSRALRNLKFGGLFLFSASAFT